MFSTRMVEMQRARIFDALARIVVERGLGGATVAGVTRAAFVSPATFRALFGTVEHCFAALVEQVMGRSAGVVLDAFAEQSSWRDGVLAGLEALLVFLDAEPLVARVCLVEAMAGPPAVLERRAALLEPMMAVLDEARQSLPVGSQPPSITAEATVASVAGILHARLVSGHAPPFMSLLSELASLVVAAYLGPVAAAEAAQLGVERHKALTRSHQLQAAVGRAPVPKQLLHTKAQRARACVLYIADNPHASNKQIAAGIGIAHLGQISTLLTRLEREGFLNKRAGGAGRPNAWTLSSRGDQAVRALRRY